MSIPFIVVALRDFFQKYKEQLIVDGNEFESELENMSVSSVDKAANVNSSNYENIANDKKEVNNKCDETSKPGSDSIKKDPDGNSIEEFHDPQNDEIEKSEP